MATWCTLPGTSVTKDPITGLWCYTAAEKGGARKKINVHFLKRHGSKQKNLYLVCCMGLQIGTAWLPLCCTKCETWSSLWQFACEGWLLHCTCNLALCPLTWRNVANNFLLDAFPSTSICHPCSSWIKLFYFAVASDMPWLDSVAPSRGPGL